MESKLKVSLIKASELVAEGYEVECYLVLPDAVQKKKRVEQHPQVSPDAYLSVALQGKPPRNGASGVMWIKLRKHFWDADVTTAVTRKSLETWAQKNGGTKNHISQFIHAYKCLRVVQPRSKS